MIGDCAVILTSDPVTFRDPVKLCTSSCVSPNFVDPLSCIIEELTNSVWNSCAVTVPATSKFPDVIISPSASIAIYLFI